MNGHEAICTVSQLQVNTVVLALQKQSTTDLMYPVRADFISMLCCHEPECTKAQWHQHFKKGDIHSYGWSKTMWVFRVKYKELFWKCRPLREQRAREKQKSLKAFSSVASSTFKLYSCSASCFTKKRHGFQTGDDSIDAGCSLPRLTWSAIVTGHHSWCCWLPSMLAVSRGCRFSHFQVSDTSFWALTHALTSSDYARTNLTLNKRTPQRHSLKIL